MDQDTPTNPEVPPAEAPSPPTAPPGSALPDFLGQRDANPSPSRSGDDGAPAGLRILLMATAILVVGFLLYREVTFQNGPAGESGWATEYAWEVVTPDGTPVDLSRYKGRPVLLNVWATWCAPCMMEMPSLAALSKRPELKEAGVAVVLVSTDGALEPVQQFLDRVDMGDSEILIAAAPPPPEFQSPGIPATYFIAPDGQITRREFGTRDWNTHEFASELARLADEG